MKQKLCKNCKYSEKNGGMYSDMFKRRIDPPRTDNGSHFGYWPIISGDEPGCGRYEEREDEI